MGRLADCSSSGIVRNSLPEYELSTEHLSWQSGEGMLAGSVNYSHSTGPHQNHCRPISEIQI